MDNFTSFTRFKLSESDTKLGSILTSLNIAVLQNQRVNIAEQKLNLPFTPNDVLAYTQQEAYLKGQLDMLTYLIDASTESQSPSQNQILEY